MVAIGRYEIHPGSRPKERRVYARLDTGTLRRLNKRQTQTLLLRHDTHQLNEERKPMKRRISIDRKKFIFFAIAAVVLIVALTVNFPSF